MTMDDGRWTMDGEMRWTMDDGHGRWTMDETWTMDDGRWTMDDGRWTWTMDDARGRQWMRLSRRPSIPIFVVLRPSPLPWRRALRRAARWGLSCAAHRLRTTHALTGRVKRVAWWCADVFHPTCIHEPVFFAEECERCCFASWEV